MNFPSKITLAKVAIAAIAVGTTITISSDAHALQLTGALGINGSVVVNDAANATNFNFVDSNGSVSGNNFNVGFSTLGFDDTPGTITGNGIIKTPLTLDSSGNFSGPTISKFISGLFLSGQALSFDLKSFTRGAPVLSSTPNTKTYFYNSLLTGVFKVGSQYLGEGSLTSTFTIPKKDDGKPATGQYGAVLVPGKQIPTPALLPGLIALGAGVLRKRKAEAAAESVA